MTVSESSVPDRADLAPALQAFLRDNVGSLDQLEMLARLVQTPDRWWDTTSAAEALRISTRAAGAALEALASRNLMEISLTTDVRYRFQPGTPTLHAQCEAFAEAYRTEPLAVIRFVTDAHRRAVRDFADAFRVRRSCCRASARSRAGRLGSSFCVFGGRAAIACLPTSRSALR